MTAVIRRIQTLDALRRELARREHQPPATPHWREREWQYQPAATHGDSASFRARQIARGLRTKEPQQ